MQVDIKFINHQCVANNNLIGNNSKLKPSPYMAALKTATKKQERQIVEFFPVTRNSELREMTGLSQHQINKIKAKYGLEKDKSFISEVRKRSRDIQIRRRRTKDELLNTEEPKKIFKFRDEEPKVTPKPVKNKIDEKFVMFGVKRAENKEKLTRELNRLTKELSLIPFASNRADEIIKKINQIEIMTN